MRDANHQTPPKGHRALTIHAEEVDVPVKVLEQPAAWIASRFRTTDLDPTASTGGDAVHAYANHGRWVAGCPDCQGAQLTAQNDRRFLCTDCGNRTNRGRYRPVVWPDEWQEIGRLLDARADITTRNWSPPETAAELAMETAVEAPGQLYRNPGWEGHTHSFPKRLPTGQHVVPCRECGLPVPKTDILIDRGEL